MSEGDLRGDFLFQLPSSVYWEFCRVMDGLLDLDWTRFASEVLKDQTEVRLADRRERRTDWVMNNWGNRNGRVGELIDLLESLQLLRPRDIILSWMQSVNPPPPPPPTIPAIPPPPYEQSAAQPTAESPDRKPLPGPAPPPVILYSENHQQPPPRPPPPLPPAPCSTITTVICWTYEEVHAGTRGFSPSLQVGEGGFGVVYRATLNNMDCAVKRLRQDSQMDWTLLRKSFQTEVENLSKFRHPNIVDLLGFSEGEGGLMCLIYSYMENRSLEDQLQNALVFSWPDRVSIVKGAAAALQFLHCPPSGQEPLIHGDVKSSNILLDQHLVPKLSDFGLARYVPRSPSGCSTQTASVGKTTTVRGTLAYLPDEYVRRGELCTAVDVYSFGVVLLEVLTGRRALEQDSKSGERYLKDLVDEVDDGPSSSTPEAWRRHLDQRLTAGGAAEPDGYLQVVTLARKSLNRQRKKRPAMTEVFHQLKDLCSSVRKSSSSSTPQLPQPPYQSFPRPPRSLDSSITAVSQQVSRLGPSEQTYPPSRYSSSSSFGALTPPHPLHSSCLGPLPLSLSLAGPCETDESRGFSQYELQSQVRSNGTSCRSKNQSPASSAESQFNQPSVPTEDQYNYPSHPSSASTGSSMPGAAAEAEFSPAGSLQSTSVGLSDGGTSSEDLRGPEESDELEYLPAGRS
ncbi:interleukin-1 receptor-associated kinase 1 isoform 2-T2 [Anableps anableps]